MTDDPEKLLGEIPLPEVPDSLERRVAAAVDAAQRRQTARRQAVVPLWAFAAGCLACTLVGFLIHPLVQQPASPPRSSDGIGAVFIVEPSRPDLRILGTSGDREHLPFWQEKRNELKPLVRSN